MAGTRTPIEVRVARLVVGVQATAALAWAVIVSALLVLPGILPGFAPKHGR